MEEIGKGEPQIPIEQKNTEPVFDACKIIIGSSAIKRAMENPDIYDGADPCKIVMIRHIASSRPRK